MVYLDHPAIDKRATLYPGITSLKDLKDVTTDCFTPHQYLIFKINIDNNGAEYVEYSKLALYDYNKDNNIVINNVYIDIRNCELYTIKETDLYKHYDCINKISNLAKRGYDNDSIESCYHEFLKDLYSKDIK
jgi:hypothetical protein